MQNSPLPTRQSALVYLSALILDQVIAELEFE
jgi:hypothetical protein